MQTPCDDLRAEYQALAELCATLDAAGWRRPSAFYGWSAWDEIAHLLYFDQTALQSVTNPEAFRRDADGLNARTTAGEEISAIARERFGALDGPSLLAAWCRGSGALVDALEPLDPKARLSWYGPSMSARSFATARLMETWAHGQDIWDVAGRRRPASDRLRHIAHIGVTTFGWTFVNRSWAVPDVKPRIELSAPDGSVWTWGEPGSADVVRGSAEDFCLLVTQRRHLDDTGLQYSAGPLATWLSVAQCFAGPPADGPAAGVRRTVA